MIVRFAIVPANESDVTVARYLLEPGEAGYLLGDKGYQGSGVYAEPRSNLSNVEPEAPSPLDEADGGGAEGGGDGVLEPHPIQAPVFGAAELVLVGEGERVPEGGGPQPRMVPHALTHPRHPR